MPWDILVEVRGSPFWHLCHVTLVQTLSAVIGQIFALISPRDLLSLARTSKALRAFLMSRKSAAVWKKARMGWSESIPERPPRLSEPQFIEFLFGTSCIRCGEPDVERTIWALCGRWCPPCKAERVVRASTIEYLTDEVARDTRCKDHFLPYARLMEPGEYWSMVYYDRQEAVKFKGQWKRCKAPEEKKQLTEKWVASVKEQQKRAIALKAWGEVQDRKRAQERATKCRARAAAILERLKAEGWAEEINKMLIDQLEKFYKLDVVDKPVPLTEDGWNDIKQGLFMHMGVVRTARLQEERYRLTLARLKILREVVAAFEDSLGPRGATSDLRAEFADLAQLPVFRDLVESPLESVTKETIHDLRNAIPALQEEWYNKRKSEFEELVRKRRTLRTDTEPLSLAIVTFDCTRCPRRGLRWPNVLAHRCGRGVDYTPESKAYMHAVLDLCHSYKLPYPWRRQSAFEASFASESAKDMIRACGYDPLRVTHKELQTQGKRLYCKICSVPSVGYMVVYDWTNAASHVRPLCDVRDTIFGPPAEVKASKWTILDAEHTASVLAVEAARRAAGALPNAIFGCTRCRYRSRGFPINHCVGAHDIKRPVMEDDFFLHPETPELTSESVTIYPEDARGDRTAAKDVKRGHGFFSSSLFVS
ncbi:hypothetical protein BV20DRAFT_962163 [Pilatotrama ljubarskyi]|nr:hypothetical protein BV20DRAFT_962163 [Pilatotrama ljubarskyi]